MISPTFHRGFASSASSGHSWDLSDLGCPSTQLCPAAMLAAQTGAGGSCENCAILVLEVAGWGG